MRDENKNGLNLKPPPRSPMSVIYFSQGTDMVNLEAKKVHVHPVSFFGKFDR